MARMEKTTVGEIADALERIMRLPEGVTLVVMICFLIAIVVIVLGNTWIRQRNEKNKGNGWHEDLQRLQEGLNEDHRRMEEKQTARFDGIAKDIKETREGQIKDLKDMREEQTRDMREVRQDIRELHKRVDNAVSGK